jgi:hypothetical protein
MGAMAVWGLLIFIGVALAVEELQHGTNGEHESPVPPLHSE